MVCIAHQLMLLIEKIIRSVEKYAGIERRPEGHLRFYIGEYFSPCLIKKGEQQRTAIKGHPQNKHYRGAPNAATTKISLDHPCFISFAKDVLPLGCVIHYIEKSVTRPDSLTKACIVF